MAHGNLFARPDTFFGTCQALGEDFGFDPLWLRVGLAVLVLWQPVWVIAGYLALGVPVLALRLLIPDRAATAAPADADADSDAGGEEAAAWRAAA